MTAFDYTQGSPMINPPCVTQWTEPFGCRIPIVSGWQWDSIKSLANERRLTQGIHMCSSRGPGLIGPPSLTRRFRLFAAHSTRTCTSFLFNSIITFNFLERQRHSVKKPSIIQVRISSAMLRKARPVLYLGTVPFDSVATTFHRYARQAYPH